MQNTYSKNNGFTLIETIIYLALFAIVIGGGMVAAYQVIEATNTDYNHIVLQEEANFLLRKIDTTLTGLNGSSSIITPSTISDTTLTVTKNGVQYSICLVGTNLVLQKSSACSASSPILNSSSIAVSLTPSLHLFSHVTAAGEPDAIITSFTLTTLQNGRAATESFTTTKYLRK